MSSISPASVLFSSDGYELSVVQNASIPTGTRAIIVAGSDGTNARPLTVDSSGRGIVVGAGTAGTPTGGVITIQGIASGTAVTVSGTVTSNIGTTGGLALDATLAKLTISQGTALGTNTQAMVGGSVTTAAPTYTTGNINPLSLTTAGALRVDGSGVTQPVSGTITANAGTGNFTVVQATASNLNATIVGTTAAGSGASSGLITVQGNASGTPIPVSGTVTATNASVSTTGTTPPGSATYIGGSVTTAAPTYTTGQMNALSLTTGGLLRVDGSGATQPVSGTITANIGTTNGLALDATLAKLTIAQSTALGSNTQAMVGGSVTTAAPTYTTGNINPLSLTTAGALRVDGSGTTQPVSGTVTANAGTGNFTVVQATAANLNATVVGTTAAGSGASSGLVTVQGNASGTPIPVNFSSSDGTQTGTLGSLNAAITIAMAGYAGAGFQLAAGTLVGTLVAEVSVDGGTTYVATQFNDVNTSQNSSSIVFGSSNTAQTKTIVGSGGVTHIRVRVSAYTSGTANGTIKATQVRDPSTLTGSPAGGAPAPVVSQMGGSVTTAAPTYTNGTQNALSLTTSGLLRVDSSGSTSPISGTVTANQGTANTAANGWFVRPTDGTNNTPAGDAVSRGIYHRITDGTNQAAVKAASTAAVTTDPALVVAISPNNSLNVVTDKCTTGTVTSVAASTSSVSLLASNANRVLATVYNESSGMLYLKLGSTASLTSYTIRIFPNSYWELPASYTGAIDGIWNVASGSVRITELT